MAWLVLLVMVGLIVWFLIVPALDHANKAVEPSSPPPVCNGYVKAPRLKPSSVVSCVAYSRAAKAIHTFGSVKSSDGPYERPPVDPTAAI